jgi:hypothetical protein
MPQTSNALRLASSRGRRPPEAAIASGIIASPGSGRRFSRTVAKRVARAMTEWKEHLSYLHDRSQTGLNRYACRRADAS